MRGLFTQTVALRLRSAEETRMVLGDGMAALAPAHRISPAAPGTGYVVGDDGTVDLVRADWWSDELVRQAAATYPAPIAAAAGANPTASRVDAVAPVAIAARPRKPRSPHASRRPAPVVVVDGEVDTMTAQPPAGRGWTSASCATRPDLPWIADAGGRRRSTMPARMRARVRRAARCAWTARPPRRRGR